MRTLIVSLLALGSLLSAAQAPQQPKAQPKQPAKAFSILRTDNQPPISLASYRGKVVMLIFISTTCPHCQEFTKELVPIANDYSPRGVQFVECAVNGGAAESVPGFVRQFKPPFPVGYNTQAVVDEYLQRTALQTFYVPHAVFLNRVGKIVGDYPGESDFMKNPATNTRAELDKMLKPAAPAGKKAPTPAP
jgi:thiol-disulfide isomerase/thioredoxin